MKAIRLIVLFALTLGIVFSQSHSAAEHRVGIGPRVGYYDSKEAEEGKFFYGAQIRAFLTSWFALEGSLDFRKEDYDGVEVKSQPLMATALFYLIPGGSFSPYLLVGAGWYSADIETEGEKESETEFGYHGGGGIEFPVAPRVYFNTDIRLVVLDYSVEERIGMGQEDIKADFWAITGALTFYF